MPPITPYTAALDGRDPLVAIPHTMARIESLTSAWSPGQFERPYAPGKWSARQILIHLAQSELALGTRTRMALTTPDYTAQPFNQDAWMMREGALGGHDAVRALSAIARMNVAVFAALSHDDRQIAFSHPEYGLLTVDWIMHQIAGHQIHHLAQLEGIS